VNPGSRLKDSMFKTILTKNFRFPLTIKIALSLIFIIIIVMGISTILDIKETREEMENYERKNNLSAFTAAIPIIENAVWQVEFKDVNSTLNQMMKNSNVISVAVFTEREKILSYLERGIQNENKAISIDKFINQKNKKILVEMELNKKNIYILQTENREKETFTLSYPLFINNLVQNKPKAVKIGYLIMVYSTKNISLATKGIIYKSISLSTLLGIVIVVTCFLFIRKLVINPIKELEKSSIKIANNEFVQTPAKNTFMGHDEIDSLTINFNYMVKQIVKLIKDEKEQQRMANELETAKIIQKSFIPTAKNLRVGYFELSGFFQSASECGGDWWHFYPLADKKIMLMLGDVTGHGTPSAMLTAAVKGYCDSIYGRKNIDPSIILEELDIIVRSSGGGDELVMTMFVAILDPIKQKLLYSNAAQNFPFIINEDSNTTSPTTLLGNGKRLGYLAPMSKRNNTSFKNHSIDFKVDNILFLYSDGLTEAKNMSKREYSERRLIKKLKGMHTKVTGDIITEIKMDLIDFTEGTPFEDDVTFVACRFCKAENSEYSNELIQYFTPKRNELEDSLINTAS
jgi:phosphoserine phosphatase RsbU/P